MGSQSSGGRVGPSNISTKLAHNLQKLTGKFPLSADGYFGRKGTGKVRIIEGHNAEKTAKDFWSRISTGGRFFKAGPGVQGVLFSDGSKAYLRIKTSSKGSPAIHIEISSKHNRVKNKQKIHFTQKKKES